MRIAFLRKKYTFHGGAEGILQDILSLLVKEGHEVHVFAIKWEGAIPSEKVHFHKVPAIRFNSFLRDLSFAVSTYYMMKNRRDCFDIIQSYDKTLFQDVLYVADGCHIEWLKQRLKRKGLLEKLAVLINPYHWLILTIEKMIYKGGKFRKIIALSEMVKKNIMDNYHVSGDDIATIYHRIDIDKFHPRNAELYRREIRERHSIGEDEFVVLFVGSGFERKGVPYLLDAIELLDQPVTALVVGKGPQEKFIRHGRKQKVIFCGPQKDVPKYYGASDIFVLLAMYEPFGLVCLEAMASGLPVVTSRYSGAAEIIQDNVHGFVVPEPDDIRGTANRIALLLDKEKRLMMGRNARDLAEKFGFKGYTDEIMKLYNGIIQQKK